MRERAQVSKSKRKQESVLRKMSITMINKITRKLTELVFNFHFHPFYFRHGPKTADFIAGQ